MQGAENLDVSAGVQNSDKMGCGNSGMDGWAKKKHPFDGQKRGPPGS